MIRVASRRKGAPAVREHAEPFMRNSCSTPVSWKIQRFRTRLADAEPGVARLMLGSVQGRRHSRLYVPHGRAFRPNQHGPPLAAAEGHRARIPGSAPLLAP